LLSAVAQYFEIDLDDPRQRDWLLHVLVDVIFDRRKRGRPSGTKSAWSLLRRARLAGLYEETKRQNPKLSDTKIAKLICEHKEFKNDDPEQIRQRLRSVSRQFANVQVVVAKMIPDIDKPPNY
jgi:hypothetical protein